MNTESPLRLYHVRTALIVQCSKIPAWASGMPSLCRKALRRNEKIPPVASEELWAFEKSSVKIK